VKGGVYANLDEIDFGTLTSPRDHQRVPLAVINVGQVPVEVINVAAVGSDPALGIMFKQGMVLNANTEKAVAHVTFTGAKQGKFAGRLRVLTNSTSSHLGPGATIEIPYRARVIHGSLRYQAQNATFEGKAGRVIDRELIFTNQFPVPVALYSARVTDRSFQVVSFPSGTILGGSGGTSAPMELSFSANSSDLSFTTQLIISTNISLLSIPLHVFHGRLIYKVPLLPTDAHHSDTTGAEQSGDAMDFGLLGINEARARTFNISNPNPVPMRISSVYCTLVEASLRLEYVQNSDGVLVLLNRMAQLGKSRKDSISGLKIMQDFPPEQNEDPTGFGDDLEHGGELQLELGPGYTAVFVVELSIGHEQRGSGEVVIKTQKERRSIPVLFESLVGSLSISPSLVRFHDCFPGVVRTAQLMARSTYMRSLVVTAVTSADARLHLSLDNSTIPPSERVNLGTLQFDVSAGWKPENAILDSFDEKEAASLAASGHLSRTDLKALRLHRDEWAAYVRSVGGELRSSISLHTDVVAGYPLNIHAALTSPTILAAPSLNFSIVEVGKSSLGVLQLVNPTSFTIAVALLEPTLAEVPAAESLESGTQSQSFLPCQSCDAEDGAGGAIKCSSCKLSSSEPALQSTGSGRNPFRLPPGAVRMAVMEPWGTATIGPVEFAPDSHLHHSRGFIAIRNNLTWVEELALEGRGGGGALEFQQEGEGLDGILSLEINASTVGFFPGTSASELQAWPITVHKDFHAINTGNMPLRIDAVWLVPKASWNDPEPRQTCRVSGFELLQCGHEAGVELGPDDGFSVGVSYRVDDVRLISQCMMLVETSRGLYRLVLSASVASELVPQIRASLSLTPGVAWQRRASIVLSAALATAALAFALLETCRSNMRGLQEADGCIELKGAAATPSVRAASTARDGVSSGSKCQDLPGGATGRKQEHRNAETAKLESSWSTSVNRAYDDGAAARMLHKVDGKGSSRRRRRRRVSNDIHCLEHEKELQTSPAVQVVNGDHEQDVFGPSWDHSSTQVDVFLGERSDECGRSESPVCAEQSSCVKTVPGNCQDLQEHSPSDGSVQPWSLPLDAEQPKPDNQLDQGPGEPSDEESLTASGSCSSGNSPLSRKHALVPGKEICSESDVDTASEEMHVRPLSVESEADELAAPSSDPLPGSKRIAHAATLTPLQTSGNSYLGTIMSAAQEDAGTRQTPQVAPLAKEPDPSAAVLGLGSGSPLNLPNDSSATPTPRSARRRRRRRGSSTTGNQAVTPMGSQWVEPTAFPQVASVPSGPSCPASASQPPQRPHIFGALQQAPLMQSQPVSSFPLHSPLGGELPQLSAVPASCVCPDAATYLNQLRAEAGVPDSVYSIWGGSSVLTAPPAVSTPFSSFNDSGTLGQSHASPLFSSSFFASFPDDSSQQPLHHTSDGPALPSNGSLSFPEVDPLHMFPMANGVAEAGRPGLSAPSLYELQDIDLYGDQVALLGFPMDPLSSEAGVVQIAPGAQPLQGQSSSSHRLDSSWGLSPPAPDGGMGHFWHQ